MVLQLPPRSRSVHGRGCTARRCVPISGVANGDAAVESACLRTQPGPACRTPPSRPISARDIAKGVEQATRGAQHSTDLAKAARAAGSASALSSVESVELETDKRRLNWFGVRTGRVERLGSVKLARRAPARSTALPSGAGGSISRNLTGRRGGFHPRWPPSGAGPRRRCSESPEETLADGPGCSATGQT